MAGELAFSGNSSTKKRVRAFDWAIGRLAERQHAVVAYRQLIEIGLTADQIRYRVQIGRLRPIHRGVYAVGHKLLTREGWWMAAVLAAGEGAVLSHRPAGQHWGLIRPGEYKIEVTAPTWRRQRPGFKLHSWHLLPDEVTTHEGIPITTVARTQLDLAVELEIPRLRKTFAEVESRQLFGRLSIEDLLDRYPRHRGSAKLREICAQRGGDGITRSQLEDAFQSFLDRYRDLPEPATNVYLLLDGKWIEVDCLWRSQKLVLELDGRRVHDNEDSYESDRDRDRLLTAHGFRPIRATWRDVTVDHAQLHHDIKRALEIAPDQTRPRTRL